MGSIRTSSADKNENSLVFTYLILRWLNYYSSFICLGDFETYIKFNILFFFILLLIDFKIFIMTTLREQNMKHKGIIKRNQRPRSFITDPYEKFW